MARNVYNLKEIKEWIDISSAASEREEIAKWIKSTVRSHILNELCCYEPVEEVEEGMPDWALRGIEEGTLVRLDFDSWLWGVFLEDFEHAMIFVETIRGSINVSFADACREGLELVRIRNEKSSDREDWSGLETLITSSEGYTWVSLTSHQNLARESKFMQHCVGQSHHYLKGIEEGVWKIYSLRDTQNKPHCTIQHEIITNSIVQIKGKQNTTVIGKYQRACCEFLSWLKPDFVPERDSRYLGLIRINNTVYNIDLLPDGLEVQDNLNLAGYGLLEKLPSNLTVHGNLSISRTNIRELPQNLYVGGSFSAANTPLRKIPNTVYFGGSVNISDTEVSVFPFDKVNGTLNVRGSYITSLPQGISYRSLVQHFMQFSPHRSKEKEEAIREQIRQSNLLVDSMLKHVSECISRKLAHELRMLVARKSNKFEALMQELRRRGIEVA